MHSFHFPPQRSFSLLFCVLFMLAHNRSLPLLLSCLSCVFLRLIVSVLPHGPTAFFKVSNVVPSAEVFNHGNVTAHQPEIILNNFNTRLGHRVGRFLGSFFPHVSCCLLLLLLLMLMFGLSVGGAPLSYLFSTAARVEGMYSCSGTFPTSGQGDVLVFLSVCPVCLRVCLFSLRLLHLRAVSGPIENRRDFSLLGGEGGHIFPVGIMRRFFLPRAPIFRLWTRGLALWLFFRCFLLVGVFQEPEFNGRQVVTFHNQRDYIFVRFHRYVFSEGKGDSGKEKKTRASLQVKPLGCRTLFARFGTARRTSWGSDEPLVGRLRHGVVFSCSLQALHTQQNSWGGLNVCEALLVFPRK